MTEIAIALVAWAAACGAAFMAGRAFGWNSGIEKGWERGYVHGFDDAERAMQDRYEALQRLGLSVHPSAYGQPLERVQRDTPTSRA